MTFDNIHVDILRLIVKEISYKPDLLSVCLVNKTLNEIALARLYKEIEVDVGTDKDSKLTQLFTSRNAGLKHIKELTLNYPEGAEWKQAQLAISMILEAVPFHQLENFHWNSWDSTSVKNVEVLCKRQRALTDVEVLHLDEKLSDDVIKRLSFDDVVTDSIERLYLYMNSADSIEYAHQLLKRVKKPLKHMRVHAHFDNSDEANTADNPLQDSDDHSGRIFRTLWKHKIGQDSREQIKVKTIHLHKLALHRAESWYRMIDMNNLTSLQLHRCDGAPEALSVLCRNNPSALQLKDFTIQHCENQAGGDVRGALNTFLSVVPELDSISIDLCCAQKMIRTQPVCRHGKTLKYLSVFETKQHDENEWHTWKPDELKEIAKKCPQLEQISIAGIDAEVTDGNSESALAKLEEALTGEDSVLDNLRTLHFVTWPYTNKIEVSLPRMLYDAMLQAHALTLFNARNKETPKLSSLGAVAWGSTQDDNHFTGFVRGTQAPILGPSTTAAIPVTADWINHNHYGPRGILKTEHIKTIDAPCQDRNIERENLPRHVKKTYSKAPASPPAEQDE